MKYPAQWILSTGAALAFAGMLAFSAPAMAASPPDPAANPVLAQLIKEGARVYFMGGQSGLNGWFIAKDNQVQMAYSLPGNNKSIVMGVQFDAAGQNISAQQIKALYDNNPEVKNYFNNLNTQQGQASMQTGVQPTSFSGMPPAASPSSMMAPSTPGERLLQALQDAAGVNVGAPAAPRLMMVADPNCPHCQAAWKALRDAVFGGKLQIRLVPIDAVDPDSARAAAQFLHAAIPLEAWDKYVGGDHSQLAGAPDDASLAAIRANHALIDSWHIQMTPYFVYRAKDGQVKILQGEPEKAVTILNDIAS
jgi:protein-disulfide isomerase